MSAMAKKASPKGATSCSRVYVYTYTQKDLAFLHPCDVCRELELGALSIEAFFAEHVPRVWVFFFLLCPGESGGYVEEGNTCVSLRSAAAGGGCL